MLAPLSWLKDYVNIKSDTKSLGLRLTEVGLGTESITKTPDGDTILDLEITPNRPDLLSIIGISREVAAIENTKIEYPALKTNLTPKKGVERLPIKISPNTKIVPRLTGIVINNITVKDSPKWLKEKLAKLGQRPINNIVDISNFVMFELGNPIHAFDYNKITGAELTIKQADGGESFETVDGISYHLPKGAVIYEDSKNIIDLVGIKGGKNSGTYPNTKSVFITVPVVDPILVRRASQALGLRSEASAIFERNVNRGGTVDALRRTVDLILELAGGELASELIDLKQQAFNPWKLSLRLDRLEFVLGIKIPEKEVADILNKLNLHPVRVGDSIEVTVPTYRNDLQIEEDLIEEVARIYGYNNFPKTLPVGEIPINTIPYYKDYKIDEKVKNLLTAAGLSEIYTYNLISENDLNAVDVSSEEVLRVDTPVSREFEYLRPSLKINLKKALDQNKINFPKVNLFELGKVYKGKSIDEAKERYHLAGITNSKSFFEVKGVLERLYNILGIDQDPTELIELLDKGVYFEIDYTELLDKIKIEKTYAPVAKFPPVIEDMSIIAPENIKTGDLITTIKKQSVLVADVTLSDKYKDTRTFHVVYQSPERNLKNTEVSIIREKILKTLKEKFGASFK